MTDTTRTPASNETREPIGFDQRTRRVLELRRMVREGLYRPDPEEVARAILAEWIGAGLELESETPPHDVSTLDGRRQAGARFVLQPDTRNEGCEEVASA